MHGLPQPVREYGFTACEGRRHRADFAWVESKVLLEVDGGTWARKGSKRCPVCRQTPQGRHSTGSGSEADREKRNLAVVLGYKPLTVTPSSLMTVSTLALLRRVLT